MVNGINDAEGRLIAMASQQNPQRPKIQSHGYNGSEPTRICPNCQKEKPLSEFGF